MEAKGITVNELFNMCLQEIKRGNGKKYILISDDDEGNGFHTLFYGLSSDKETIDYALQVEHDNHTADEVVILG